MIKHFNNLREIMLHDHQLAFWYGLMLVASFCYIILMALTVRNDDDFDKNQFLNSKFFTDFQKNCLLASIFFFIFSFASLIYFSLKLGMTKIIVPLLINFIFFILIKYLIKNDIIGDRTLHLLEKTVIFVYLFLILWTIFI